VAPRLAAACLTALILAALAPRARADDPPADEKAQAAKIIVQMKSKDPEERVKAADAAASLQHDSLTSPLVRLLADKELGVREAALRALGQRGSAAARRKAAAAVAARLTRLDKHPGEKEEIDLVIETLKQLKEPLSIKALLEGIVVGMDLGEVKARLFAVAEVPDKQAIERLIAFLALGRRGGRGAHRKLADQALRYATGSKPGADERTVGRDADRWRAWWREHERDFSFEAVAAARAEAAAAAKAREERRRKREEAREKRRQKKHGKKSKDGDDSESSD
jgi:hypothetical protein